MAITTSKQVPETLAIQGRPAWYRALALHERARLLRTKEARSVPLELPVDRELADQKLQDWKAQPPFPEGLFFAERLAFDGLTEQELFLLLGEADATGFQRMQNVPDWLNELAVSYAASPASEEARLSASVQGQSERPGAKQNQNSQIFLPFAQPLIARGVERLKQGLQTLLATFPSAPLNVEAVPGILLANLVSQLLTIMSRTLTLELHVARLEERLIGETPEERFQDFARLLSQEETRLALLEEYAPLARILVNAVDHWVRSHLELLERLCADWEQIRLAFFPQQDPGLLVGVQGGIGDLHREGHSTLILTFASGRQLVYKPRSLAIDVHFQQLLTWLNEHGATPSLRTIHVIDRGNYGWSEFVVSEPCSSLEDVEHFYERQGAYLALFYALEATDFHAENLIAAGEHPVMIDLESLFHPQLNRLLPRSALYSTSEAFSHSVLRVGLLPQRVWGNRDRSGIDLSGLGAKEGQSTPRPVLQIEASGTDQMRFIRQHVSLPGKQNRPIYNGQPVEVLDYRTALVQGFAKMYRLLMQHHEELLADPIQSFIGDETRLILRATNTYAQLLHESYHPDLLRDTLDRDQFFDRLWVSAEQRPFFKACIAAEQADLHAGDIPFFTTYPGTRDVFTSSGKRLANFLSEPSIEQVRRNLRQLSEGDLKRQTWLIESSLLSIPMGTEDINHTRIQPSLIAGPTHTGHEELLQAACLVADRLCELAFLHEQNAAWMGLTFVMEREWTVLPADTGLYSGVSGIALFLAYLGDLTKRESYTRVAQAALLSVFDQVEDLQQSLKAVGGFGGWGSIIYLYTHLALLWQDNSLLQKAAELVGVLPEMVDQDELFDIISGTAGCLLALLSLYQVCPSPTVLEVACYCGDHLLKKAPVCQKDPAGFAQSNGHATPLTGFSHGAAGIALSLLKLATISGEERFRQGASTALEYERSLFSEEQQNWPDLRDWSRDEKKPGAGAEGREMYMMAWCHGAPGIGMARLAALPYLDDALIRAEIQAALQTTLRLGFLGNHSLCHGSLGNLETILQAGRLLDSPEYRAHTQRLSAGILESIKANGWLTGVPMGAETPGLLAGIAGIGYELLRLAEPEKVPSVLLLEAPHSQSRRSESDPGKHEASPESSQVF